MRIDYYVYILILYLIKCTPPPVQEPFYEPIVYPDILVKNEKENSPLKILEESQPTQFLDIVNITVNFLENGREEIHK